MGIHRSNKANTSPTSIILPVIFIAALGIAYGLMFFGIVDFAFTGLYGVALLAFVYCVTLLDLRVGLVVFIIATGLSPEFTVFGIDNFRIEDLILPVLLFAWLTQSIGKRDAFVPTDLKVPIILYFGLALLSSLNGAVYTDLEVFRSFLHFFKTLSYYLVFLLVLNNVRTESEIKGFVWVIIISAATVGAYGFYEYIQNPDNPGVMSRVSGPSGETANILGGYYVFHMLLAFGMLLSIEGLVARVSLIGLLLIQIVPLLFTFSRTSLAALLGGTFGLGILARRWHLIVALVIATVLAPFFLPENLLNRFRTITQVLSSDAPKSWTDRVQMWERAANRIARSPLIGGGVARDAPGGLDNEFVKQADDLGIIGLTVFSLILFRIGRTALVNARSVRDPVLRGFCHGFLGGFVAILVHCIGATALTSIRIAEPFFFATGLLYAIDARRRAAEESPQVVAPVPGHPPGGGRKAVRPRPA